MAQKEKAKKPLVAVIGYGSQGRAIALNLKDSGYPVTAGLRPGSKSRRLARNDGITDVCPVPKAVALADIVALAFPDHLHGRVFQRSIEPFLKPGTTLWFLHGLSVHFGLVKPPRHCDVILIAPHAPGLAVREGILSERSISCFYAVSQNPSQRAMRTAIALAAAVGIAKGNLLKTTFAAEAVGDIFGEQAVLCGGLAMLIKSGFETLVESGLKPENAWLEVAYQLDLIVDLIKRYGIEGMFSRISVTARYGSLTAGPKLIDQRAKTRMKQLLSDITSGRFAQRLNRLEDDDIVRLNRALKSLSNPKLEKAARKFR
jgi:ketol-acid reductoisomerase